MPPLTIMIKPASSLCDLRCSYCFYADEASHRDQASYGIMNEETLEKLVRRAFAYGEGCIQFMFQGGEPTMAGKDFFRRFIRLTKKYGHSGNVRIVNAIQTNGYAIDQEWCDIFREGQFLVGVSLDGTKETHDACRISAAGKPTYDRIRNNIHLLEANRVEYNVLCVVNEYVARQPVKVFENLKGYRYLQFIPCLDGFDNKSMPFSLNSRTYGRFLIETFDLYEHFFYAKDPVSVRNFDNWIQMLLGNPPESCALSGRCGIYFVIEADGSVYPCDFYVLDQWRMGNINEHSFFRLEKSDVSAAFREESFTLPEACRNCRWIQLCRGGCKRDREPLVNGQSKGNRLCEGHKMFFEARYDRLKALAGSLQVQR